MEGRRSSRAELYDGGQMMTWRSGIVPMMISVEICTLLPQYGSTENYNTIDSDTKLAKRLLKAPSPVLPALFEKPKSVKTFS